MSYQNIPEELRTRKQWICWRLEDIGAKKATKIPYNPLTGKMASVNVPEDWASFEEAVKHVAKYSGIGFVFTDRDPYTFIDLDDTEGNETALDRQIRIFQELDSYSEVSPSGKGLHIIIKGCIPAGRRRSFIEIYSSQRYATFTGNVYPAGKAKPIVDRQNELVQLYDQMGEGQAATILYQGEKEARWTDAEVIGQAKLAVNGEKFNDLLLGKWEANYQSQSEADFAFIDILAFYSKNRTQITRIFRASPLGQRDKANRDDYVRWMVNKSFDKMLPQLDFDGFKNALENKLAEQTSNKIAENNYKAIGLEAAVSSNGKTAAFEAVNVGSIPATASNYSNDWIEGVKPPPAVTIPPGLTGQIAQFIYAASPRPVPEIALAAAIGLMGGITGRAYNVSGTGLNQYVLLLAATGSGKEAMASGIDKLMGTIRLQVPTSVNFIGPSEIASGQALLKHLGKTSQCFVTMLGEFGLRLQQLSQQHANSAEVGLRRMLLDLYNKSGYGQFLHGNIYADREKNIEMIASPAFSILGESTPERFYGALNEDMISEGLLPRFLLIEYTGPRVPLNPAHSQAKPSFQLIEQLASLAAQCEMVAHANPRRVINVQVNMEAEEILNAFDKHADRQINVTTKDTIKQLWNRAHIKVLKLSGILAVGCNMLEPVITPELVQWAINTVQNDIRSLTYKFEQGEIGLNNYEIKQVMEVVRIIKDYVTWEFDKVQKYSDKINGLKMHEQRVIPYAYLSRRLMAVACFRLDKNGATNALKRCLQILIDRDNIREIGKGDLATKFGTTQRAFIVSNTSILN